MYLRAAELGWSKEKFERSTQRLFLWEWQGYIRKIERSSYSAAREVVAIVRNVNARKQDQKKAHKIFPLSIDQVMDFTYEDAQAQFERMKKAGWINNIN